MFQRSQISQGLENVHFVGTMKVPRGLSKRNSKGEESQPADCPGNERVGRGKGTSERVCQERSRKMPEKNMFAGEVFAMFTQNPGT